MAVNLSAKTSTVFHYQMLPSSFQLAEAPTYIAWQLMQSSEKLWNHEAANSSQRFINCTVAILSGVGGYLGGIIALPITLACIPVTIVADAVVGIAECSFCYYHGLSGKDIKKIAHRKFIVSPLQQFVFCSAAISATVVANACFFGGQFLRLSDPYLALLSSSILWTFGYGLGQFAVGKLPINLNHHSFNIFINGGSGETEGRKWLDDDIQPGEPSSSNPEKILKWESFIAREMCNLSRIDDARTNKKYIAFKKGIFEQKPPQELLGLNKGFTVRELKTSYRTLAPILHPDKNGLSRESTSLFVILNEAYNRLSQKV